MQTEPGREPKLQVLCIEDNEGDALLMERYLMESPLRNFDFHIEKTIRGAIAYCADPKNRPDVAIMDLDLQDARGREVFDKFHRVYDAIPVVIVSGAYNEKMRALLLEAGAYSYFDKQTLKPSNLLFEAVEGALSWTKRHMRP